jgi:hypothetical protein
LADVTGQRPGTNHGGTPGASGRIGTSYQFDGNGSSSKSYADLGFGSGSYASFSVQAWVKTTDLDGGIVTSRNGFDGNLVGLSVGGASGKPVFYAARLVSIMSPTAVSDGAWHHLVGVFEGSTGKTELYVDGTLAASGSTALVTISPAANFLLAWDAHLSTESIRYLAGSIDEVGIWSRALSAAEITTLWGNGAGFGPP